MSNVTKICNAENDLFWKRSIISHICHKVQKILPIITKIYDVRFCSSYYSELKLCILHLFFAIFEISTYSIFNFLYTKRKFSEWILSKAALLPRSIFLTNDAVIKQTKSCHPYVVLNFVWVVVWLSLMWIIRLRTWEKISKIAKFKEVDNLMRTII